HAPALAMAAAAAALDVLLALQARLDGADGGAAQRADVRHRAAPSERGHVVIHLQRRRAQGAAQADESVDEDRRGNGRADHDRPTDVAIDDEGLVADEY